MRQYSWAGVTSGWLMAALYLAHQILTTQLARSDRFGPLREDYRGWHYLLGTVLLAAVIWRLVAWRRDGAVPPPPGVPAGLHLWGRALALTAYVLIGIAPFVGVIYAWSDDLVIHLGPLFDLPTLMARDRGVWMFTGYFHSGLGFMTLVLSVAGLLTLGWGWVRHGRGPLVLMPPGYGVQILLTMTVTVYAFATFRSPEPGPRAVAIFWGAIALVGLVGWLVHRGRALRTFAAVPSGFARAAAPVLAIGLVMLGAAGPWALFRVTPWPMGVKVAAPEGVTSHLVRADHPDAMKAPTPATAFEEEVRAETYKWCRFCHTVEAGGPHLVGPNLHLIFGQKAATVPGFTYSTALAGAGANGLVWTDERIAWFIADPQKHLPGTSMIISSGPIPDPAVQRAVVNLLRKETMLEAEN